MDWSYIAQELPSTTHYWRKHREKNRSGGKKRKKM